MARGGPAVEAQKPPYKLIASQLAGGFVVPFLGSGASFAGIPTDSPKRLPDERGLARMLIDEFSDEFTDYPGDEDTDPLTKVALFYEEPPFGRGPIYNHLRTKLFSEQSDAPISPMADLLSRINAPGMIIVTTNYDTQLERALERHERGYTIVTHAETPEHVRFGATVAIHSSDLSKADVLGKNWVISDLGKDPYPIIYKLHGTFVDEPNFADNLVLSESDYLDFLRTMYTAAVPVPPPALVTLFQGRHFLFLGYSLNDWNFRLILRDIHSTALQFSAAAHFPSWAIRRDPPRIETGFWQRHSVQLYAESLEDFATTLEKRLQGLGALQ